MPYLGTPAVDRFTASKTATQFSGNGSAVDFTLDHSVGSPEDILVSVDGVVQEPTVAYGIVGGTTLRFTAAPSSNAGNNIFVYYLFRTIGTVTHPPTSALSATSGTFSTTLGVTGNATLAGTIAVTGTSTLTGVAALGNTGSTVKSEGGAVTTNIAQGLCKAWINFTGISNTVARDSLNISGLTDTSAGRTTAITFTSNMDSINYSGSYFQNGSTGSTYISFNNNYAGGFGTRTTSSFAVASYEGAGYADVFNNDALIFGDLA